MVVYWKYDTVLVVGSDGIGFVQGSAVRSREARKVASLSEG